jgi:hypothetical protein
MAVFRQIAAGLYLLHASLHLLQVKGYNAGDNFNLICR